MSKFRMKVILPNKEEIDKSNEVGGVTGLLYYMAGQPIGRVVFEERVSPGTEGKAEWKEIIPEIVQAAPQVITKPKVKSQ